MLKMLLRLTLITTLLLTISIAHAQSTMTLEEIGRIGEGTARIVAWSPDGAILAVGGSGGIWLYDTTLQLQRKIDHDAITALSWHPDGSHITAVSAQAQVHTWDAQTGELIETVYNGALVNGIAWNDNTLAIADDASVHLLSEGAEIDVRAFNDKVSALAWSPDSSTLAISTGSTLTNDNGVIYLWDTSAQRQSLTIETGEVAIELEWHPDGQRLGGANNDEAIIWDAGTGEIINEFIYHPVRVQTVKFSPDGQFFASAGSTIAILNLDTWEGDDLPPDLLILSVTQDLTTAPLTSIDWGDSLIAGVGVQDVLTLWNAATGEITAQNADFTDSTPGDVVWSPDGTRIGVAGLREPGIVSIIDPTAAVVVTEYTFGDDYGASNSLAWSPDSSQIVVTRGSDDFWIWDAATGERIRQLEYQSDIYDITYMDQVSWSPDGAYISATIREDVLLWDAETGDIVMTLDRDEYRMLYSFTWSSDSRYLAAMGLDASITEGWLLVWDIASGELIHEIDRLAVRGAVDWGADPQHIVVVTLEGDVQIWNLDTETVESEWLLEGIARDVAWNTAQGWLAVSEDYFSSQPGRILILDVVSGDEIAAVESYDDVTSLDWSPDGETLASVGRDGIVHLWRVQS